MSLFRIWQQVAVVAIRSAIMRRYFATRTKTIRRFTVGLCLNSLEVGCKRSTTRSYFVLDKLPGRIEKSPFLICRTSHFRKFSQSLIECNLVHFQIIKLE